MARFLGCPHRAHARIAALALACAAAPAFGSGSTSHVRGSTAADYDKHLPWMTRQCRELMTSFMDPERTVMVEFGGGASTIFFAKHVKQLYTIENVDPFADDIRRNLHELGITNVELFHVWPDRSIAPSERLSFADSPYRAEMARADHYSDPDPRYQRGRRVFLQHAPKDGSLYTFPWDSGVKKGWCATCATKHKGDFETYATYLRAIERVPTKPDIIFCDGQARGACAFNALQYVHANTRVIIHDFYMALDNENFQHKFNPDGLLKYYHVEAKLDQRWPYKSGGTVVVLKPRNLKKPEKQGHTKGVRVATGWIPRNATVGL